MYSLRPLIKFLTLKISVLFMIEFILNLKFLFYVVNIVIITTKTIATPYIASRVPSFNSTFAFSAMINNF